MSCLACWQHRVAVRQCPCQPTEHLCASCGSCGIFHTLGQWKSFGTFQRLLNHQAGGRCQLSTARARRLSVCLFEPQPGSVAFHNLTSPHPEAFSPCWNCPWVTLWLSCPGGRLGRGEVEEASFPRQRPLASWGRWKILEVSST